MADYEQFQEFLDEHKVVYKSDELSDGDKLFRIPQRLDGGNVVDIIVFFGENYVKVVIMGIASVSNAEKLPLIYELLNEFNHDYKYSKFSVVSDGDIVLETDLVADLRDGDFQPDTLFAYIGAAWKTVRAAYPKIMKVIWS